MKKLIQLSTFLFICLFALACNKSEDEIELCELGPALPILCFHVYEPVCGCNDVTYGNECVATAAGVPSFTPGECQ